MALHLSSVVPFTRRALPTLLLVILATLTSCAQFSNQTTSVSTSDAIPENWSARGRLAIRPIAANNANATATQPTFKATSANFHWQQNGDAVILQLYGALGLGRVSIEANSQGALIRQGKEVVSQADTLSDLAWDTLALPLPTENLRYWLTGQPDPHGIYELLPQAGENTDTQIESFIQAGWSVHYTASAPVEAYVLPKKLSANNEHIGIRVVVRNWELGSKLDTNLDPKTVPSK